jgi:hypothetical protein
MPVTKVKIAFVSVGVLDAADMWGDGEWAFTAAVDGKAVGDPNNIFIARTRSLIQLPPEYSIELDVSGKTKPSDRVKVSFSANDKDVFVWDHDLGSVSYLFKFPFSRDQSIILTSPIKKGFLFLPDHQYFTARITLEVLEVKATAAIIGPKSVSASRQHDGSSNFTTLSGKQIVPRVEVCPVVPTPQSPSKLPKRPDVATQNGLTPGKATPQSQPPVLWPLPNLNATYNPSLIPILQESDPDLNSKAAKLAVTYVEPGDLDTNLLTWVVKSGPAKIIGANQGAEVTVIGTGAGASDQLAEFEVRWNGEKGTLLATFRAWVGKIKKVPFRINLINGTNPASQVVFTPQDYYNQIQIARIVHWQAGLELIPDSNTTCWDGATTKDSAGAALPGGVFIVPVTNNTWTVNVNNFVPTIASRLNFRPGVLHAVYVRSTTTGRAAATDIQGVDGKDYEMDGKPTSSWVLPSGVPPDADPSGKLKLKTFKSSDRLKNKAPGDDKYAADRTKSDSSFSSADMGRIYAVVLPSDWTWNNTGTDPNAGVNLAHELGHALGLHHRGSGDATNPPLSNDGMNCLDVANKQRGHPWSENVMTYGYGGSFAAAPRAVDIDIIQTPVVRKHPVCI